MTSLSESWLEACAEGVNRLDGSGSSASLARRQGQSSGIPARAQEGRIQKGQQPRSCRPLPGRGSRAVKQACKPRGSAWAYPEGRDRSRAL